MWAKLPLAVKGRSDDHLFRPVTGDECSGVSGFSLCAMSRLWRWGLVVVTAAAVVGLFMPGALLSGAARPASPTVAMAEEPQTAPYGCFATSCSRGTPAPATPSAIPVAAVMLGAAVVVIAPPLLRRRSRRSAGALSRERGQPLFHPPQLSFTR
jgi:hypothetical protein